MDIRNIPLDQLRYGHEASPPLNVRKVGRDADIVQLAASIAAHGLGQALNVREVGGEIFVADGNRRLAALRLNAQEGKIADDAPVKCDFGGTADGDELSLALNIERIGMHEADVLEAFRELSERGLTEEQIASRFGEDPKRVRKMLAIGKLHPKILDAWRQDELGRSPIETVRAFTMASSLDEQEQVFDRLSAKGQLMPHWVHEALGVGEREAKRLLTFVGMEAYTQGGGVVVEDLFGDNHRISDVDLLKTLATARLEDEISALRQQGWAWVSLADDLPQGWRYNWERLRAEPEFYKSETAEIKKLDKLVGDTPPWEQTDEQRAARKRISVLEGIAELRGFTSEQKAKAGVALEIDHGGELEILAGFVKPSAKKAPKEKSGGGDASPRLSNALMSRLSVQLTRASQRAVTRDPHVALAAVVAGLASKSYYGGPVRITAGGMGKEDGAQDTRRPFGESFKECLSLSNEDLLIVLARMIGDTFDMTVLHAERPPLSIEDNATLVSALPAAAVNDALREQFDAESYFAGAPKDLVVSAIAEAVNADEARKAGNLKKKDLTAFAVANVPKTGWLPPELRTVHYDGPGADANPSEVAA